MIRNYKIFLLEMSISDEKVKKYNTVLKNIEDIKTTSLELKELILDLKNELSNTKIKIKEIEDDGRKIYMNIRFKSRSEYIIEEIKELLEESENKDCFDTYFNIIYPDGNEIDFYPEVEIEKYNLNRIHVPVGLPYIIKGLGLGKKIYMNIIDKYGYISSTYLDRSIDAVYIWNSIRKEKDIYTFIFDKKVLGISSKLEFYKIEDILLEFYQDLSNEEILIDDDFQDKYLRNFRKSEKISWILDYYIKQK